MSGYIIKSIKDSLASMTKENKGRGVRKVMTDEILERLGDSFIKLSMEGVKFERYIEKCGFGEEIKI